MLYPVCSSESQLMRMRRDIADRTETLIEMNVGNSSFPYTSGLGCIRSSDRLLCEMRKGWFGESVKV